MFKSALSTYLAASSGVKSMANVFVKANVPQASQTAEKATSGGDSSSLKAAERIMKMSLEVGVCCVDVGGGLEGAGKGGVCARAPWMLRCFGLL